MFGKTNIMGKLGKSPKKRRAEMAKIFNEWETDPLRELMFSELSLVDDQFFYAQKKNVSEVFQRFIDRRILRPSNLIIMIEGPQGEGKSYIALWLATVWAARQQRGACPQT
jgi:pantothenate kinase-related protein Tda10